MEGKESEKRCDDEKEKNTTNTRLKVAECSRDRHSPVNICTIFSLNSTTNFLPSSCHPRVGLRTIQLPSTGVNTRKSKKVSYYFFLIRFSFNKMEPKRRQSVCSSPLRIVVIVRAISEMLVAAHRQHQDALDLSPPSAAASSASPKCSASAQKSLLASHFIFFPSIIQAPNADWLCVG